MVCRRDGLRARQRRQLQAGLLAAGAQGGRERAGVVLVDELVEDLGGDPADPSVEGVELSLQGRAGGGVLVGRGAGEAGDAVGDELPHRLLAQKLGLDAVEEELVEGLDPRRDARAGLAVVAARAAVVEPGPLLGVAAGRDVDGRAAGAAAQVGREQPPLAGGQATRAVALAGLSLLGPQRPLGLDAVEGLSVGGGGVGVLGDDLTIVEHMAEVDLVLDDAGDVLGAPGVAGVLAGQVPAAGRGDAGAGQALGDALGPVAALVGEAEDPLDGLEVGAGVVGDGEAAVHHGVPEGRVSVHPQALLGLGAHAALHVGGQLFGVAFGQPRQDGADELAERAVGGVLLGERDDLDVGVVQSAQRAQAVEHVAGDAGEGPDVEAVDGRRGVSAAGLAIGDLGLGPAQQALIAVAALGGAAADALVDEPVLGRDDDALRGGAALDLGALLLDGLVLAGVAAPQVGGADQGHGDLGRRGCREVDV